METISLICGLLMFVALITNIVLLVMLFVRWISKKPKKKVGMAVIFSGVAVWVFLFLCVFTNPYARCEHELTVVSEVEATCEENGGITYHCNLCGYEEIESIPSLGHDVVEISREEPTVDTEGKVVEGCTRCDYQKVTTLDKLPKPAVDAGDKDDTSVKSATFEDIYTAYKKNELAADDLYKNNRYRITATINGIETGGLFNLTGGATLTMEKRVGSTIVFFYAEFEKDQEDALKKVAVGDSITFEGTCLSAGNWIDCEIID